MVGSKGKAHVIKTKKNVSFIIKFARETGCHQTCFENAGITLVIYDFIKKKLRNIN